MSLAALGRWVLSGPEPFNHETPGSGAKKLQHLRILSRESGALSNPLKGMYTDIHVYIYIYIYREREREREGEGEGERVGGRGEGNARHLAF